LFVMTVNEGVTLKHVAGVVKGRVGEEESRRNEEGTVGRGGKRGKGKACAVHAENILSTRRCVIVYYPKRVVHSEPR